MISRRSHNQLARDRAEHAYPRTLRNSQLDIRNARHLMSLDTLKIEICYRIVELALNRKCPIDRSQSTEVNYEYYLFPELLLNSPYSSLSVPLSPGLFTACRRLVLLYREGKA